MPCLLRPRLGSLGVLSNSAFGEFYYRLHDDKTPQHVPQLPTSLCSWNCGSSPFSFLCCFSCISLLLFHDTHIAFSSGVLIFFLVYHSFHSSISRGKYEADWRNGLPINNV